MRDEPEAVIRCLNARSFRYHKRCWLRKTAGRWSWKSKSAKECVTTHLPTQLALKMDGAQASYRDIAVDVNAMCQRVGGRADSVEASGVNPSRAVGSADLGVSSKYSNENFEDRSGERFHVNITWT